MKKLVAIAALVVFFALPMITVADPPPPPGQTGGGPGGGPTPVGAPIDGGLGILVALAIGYGGWKIYRISKDRTVETGD
jgi:hypothetical protein